MISRMNRPLPLQRSQLRALSVSLSLAAMSIGCAARTRHAPPSRATPSPTARRPATQPAADVRPLFDRIGGTPTMTKVIDDFVATASTDPNVNFARKGQPQAWDATPEQVSLLKKRLVEFLSAATGGGPHLQREGKGPPPPRPKNTH